MRAVEWLNPFGLCFMAVVMVPNIVYAVSQARRGAAVGEDESESVGEGVGERGTDKGGTESKNSSTTAHAAHVTHPTRALAAAEQIGRYGCFAFMIVNIPDTWFGWWSDEAFAVYLIADTVLVLLYCALWVYCWRRPGMLRALSLSAIPSALFLFSGIMSRSIPLTFAALLFAPCHIIISCKPHLERPQ